MKHFYSVQTKSIFKLIVLFLLSCYGISAKAALAIGDIAVIGYNSDGTTSTKDFTVVTLAKINAGEVIYITDRGWTATAGGSFMADINSEGIFQWTVSSTIARGTVINFSVTSGGSPGVVANPNVGTLTVINGWTSTATTAPFGTNGDQILIYQGTVTSPTFIFGFNAGINSADVVNGWQTAATSGNAQSNLPSGLTNGTNAIGFPTTTVTSLDNYAYDITKGLSGSKSTILAKICNTDNWLRDDNTPYNIVPGTGGTQFPGTNPIFNTAPTAASVGISGTMQVSQTLTGQYAYADADGDTESGSTFKWYRSDNIGGGNKAAISAATAKTYVLSAQDLNKYISFEVTPKDGAANGNTVQSAVQGPVTDGTLPLKLVSFSAKVWNGHTVKLDWKVSDVQNNREFLIWRKGDEGVFQKLAVIPTSSNETQVFSYEDRTPLAGNNYYRLCQIDQDNTETELGIGMVEVALAGNSLLVYPNPAFGVANVSFAKGQFYKATLTDLSGKVIASKAISSTEYNVSFELASLPKGIYTVYLYGKGGIEGRKLVKE